MISFSGRTPSFTIRRRCSSVTVDLCHTCSGGGISAIGEKRGGIGARGELSKRRKTPNRAAALKTGAAVEDGKCKQGKLRRCKRPKLPAEKTKGRGVCGKPLPHYPHIYFLINKGVDATAPEVG